MQTSKKGNNSMKKQHLTLDKLCEIINSNFGEPFLISGGVFASLDDNGKIVNYC